MTQTPTDRDTPYFRWRSVTESIAGERILLATKPGVFSFGRVDPAAVLLAQHADVREGQVVVQLNCGSALFGAVAAQRATHVYLTDRHHVSVEAAQRTMQLNGINNADAMLGHGTFVLPAGLKADVVGIRIPHEKQALLQLLHDAFHMLKPGGGCYMAGANNEGVKPAQRTLAEIFGNANKLAEHSSHRVVVATKRSEAPATPDIFASPFLEGDAFMEVFATLRSEPLTVYSRPGVFSWEHPDEATTLLADHMVINAGESVLDLGCGSGALGVVAARLSNGGRVRLVDADIEAVRSSRGTIEVSGVTNCSVAISDVASAVIDEHFDVVVSNPPFHVGKATNLELPLQFIHDAWHVLNAGGRLYLVANRTLPYESMIQERFGNVHCVHDGVRFKVLSARKGADR
ncbi:MAG: methyltransferase [Phycisphaerae bacterium]|nr:methyltransferase [Gemmatimonadaceae bacterium]